VKAGKKGDAGRKERGGSSVKRLLLTPFGNVNDLELTRKEVYMVGNVNGMLVIACDLRRGRQVHVWYSREFCCITSVPSSPASMSISSPSSKHTFVFEADI
jgi:hypothetical protein